MYNLVKEYVLFVEKVPKVLGREKLVRFAHLFSIFI